ncbi:T3SS effector HopA1 family protein [Streptomyces sp. NPDC090023]|uniref:T3SS effector HopA1 family protein n=1 Tax=unclassified Streptomyces TaxID=2593676 RepID=UPI00382986E7
MTVLETDAQPLTDGLARRLADAITLVETASDGLSARIGDNEVTADTPLQLRDRLAVLIYEHLHAGRPERDETLPRSLRDPEFERLLHAATPHPSTLYRARLWGTDGGLPVVQIDGVRVRLPETGPHGPTDPDGTLRAAASRAADGEEWADIVVPSVRPALSPGFFLADGSLGRPTDGAILRLYTHITHPKYAPAAWAAVLGALERAAVPYRVKISSSPLLYPRRDALVVYLGTEELHALDTVRLAVQDVAGLGPDTSPFTHELAPGFAAAWEPDDDRPGRRNVSFGEHRAAAVAEGLVAHRLTPTQPSAAAAVAAALRDAGVDPAHPARSLKQPHADPRRKV